MSRVMTEKDSGKLDMEIIHENSRFISHSINNIIKNFEENCGALNISQKHTVTQCAINNTICNYIDRSIYHGATDEDGSLFSKRELLNNFWGDLTMFFKTFNDTNFEQKEK